MKLVDEGLKDIFDKANITDVIKAYGYLRNSGCYSRAASMSNALYYFDKETLNEYDLIIRREYRDESVCLEFYKLVGEPHIHDYISYCLTHKNNDVHEDAYELVVEFEEASQLDSQYLIQGFKGIHINKIEESNKHQIIDGVIHDGDDDMLRPAQGEMLMAEPIAFGDDNAFGNIAPNDGVVEEDGVYEADGTRIGNVYVPEPDNRPYSGPDNMTIEELTRMIQRNARQMERYEGDLGDDDMTVRLARRRRDELMENIDRVRRILENR